MSSDNFKSARSATVESVDMKKTIRRRPRATAIANRRAIICAALEVFSTRGYDGTTTRAVAKKARLKQGHLSKYFPTKESLWRGAIEEFQGEIEQILDGGLDRADFKRPLAVARTALTSLLRFFAMNHRLSRLMLQEFSVSSPRHDWVVSQIGRPIWQRLQPLFETLHARDRSIGGSPIFSYFSLIGSALIFFGSPSEVYKIAGSKPTDPSTAEEYIDYILGALVHIRPKASPKRRRIVG
jgi:TetR/AcrR family transcriptional regulator